MAEFNQIKTIRYMGNKNKLLDFIIPEIRKTINKGDIICDLMAGTCSIAYALKDEYTIYANDIQYYSYIISKALIENNSEAINKETTIKDLESLYKSNLDNEFFSFFHNNFSDTYFSEQQCKEIDSIRYAISNVNNEYKRDLYMTGLMFAMGKCESTSGHFAQYLPKEHHRLVEIRKKSIWQEFIKKSDDFSSLIKTKYNNKAFNMDYKDFIKTEDFKKVKCVYIDTPYTGEQYSRFYHILETVTKYDNPPLEYKAKYRKDRFTSGFSLRSTAKDEFKDMLNLLSQMNKTIVLSYSSKGLIPLDELEFIICKRFKNVQMLEKDYSHSTQGKGNIKITEVLFIASN